MPERRDYVIGSDDAFEPVIVIHDGKGEEVVFVE